MSLEAIRIVADGLAHSTYGVNALLDQVPRDGEDPRPPNVIVADETRDGWVSRRLAPTSKTATDSPYVAVSVVRPGDLEGVDQVEAKPWAEGTTTILIRYLYSHVATEEGTAAMWYTLRAITNSVRLLFEHANVSARVRNLVRCDYVDGMQEIPLMDEWKDSKIVGGVVLTIGTVSVTA